jgi:hypothetical protein
MITLFALISDVIRLIIPFFLKKHKLYLLQINNYAAYKTVCRKQQTTLIG